MSADNSPFVFNLQTITKELKHIIHYDEWVHDFLPKLTKRRVLVIEIPEMPIKSVHINLTKMLEELENVRKLYIEGRYDSVVFGIRNIFMNHLTQTVVQNGKKVRVLNNEIKELALKGVPEDSKDDYKEAIKAIENMVRNILSNHLSKFVHLDTGKLIRMPLKEDAQYLLLLTTAILKYLTSLIDKANK